MVSSTNNSGANAGPGVALPAESTTVSIDPVTGFTYPQLPSAVVPTWNPVTSQWMVNGTPVSVGGAAFDYMDNFTRADTTAPSLGTVDACSVCTDGNLKPMPNLWASVNGDGVSGRILSSRMTSVAGQNAYWYQTFPGKKVRHVRAKVDWKGSTIVPPVSTGTIIICQSTANWQNQAVHLQFNGYSMELDKITAGLTITAVAGSTSDSAQFFTYPNAYPIAIGSVLQIDLWLDDAGNYLVVGGGKVYRGNDPYLATCLGPVVMFQLGQNASATHTTEYQEVRVGFAALGS